MTSRQNFMKTLVRNLGKHDNNFFENEILVKKEFSKGEELQLMIGFQIDALSSHSDWSRVF